MSSSSWRFLVIFSLKPGEPHFERFAAFLSNTKTAILPLLAEIKFQLQLLRERSVATQGKRKREWIASSTSPRNDGDNRKGLLRQDFLPMTEERKWVFEESTEGVEAHRHRECSDLLQSFTPTVIARNNVTKQSTYVVS